MTQEEQIRLWRLMEKLNWFFHQEMHYLDRETAEQTARECYPEIRDFTYGFDLPLRAIREQVASAIHIVVQITRERDGSRKIVNVSEITKMEGDVITMQDLFVFRQTGWDGENRITGVFEPTGSVPTFMEEIERAKLDLDIRMFSRKSS